LAFNTLDTSISTNGFLGCLSTDGQFVFGAIVILVNMKVFFSSYQYTVWSVLATFIGPISFFIVFGAMSFMHIYQLTGDMQHLFISPETYIVLFFFGSGYLLVDYGLFTANATITSWMLR
jgi:hypothetical protein